MKVLIIDDEEAVAQIVSEIAAQGGWESAYRSRVQDIIGLVKEELPDVAMIDYRLKEGSGMELVEILREAGSTLPIILFSGYAEEINPALCKKFRIHSVLKKPLSVLELRKALNEATRSATSSRS